MMKVTCDTEQEYYCQQTVYQKLQGYNMPSQKCKGSLLVDLAAELRQMKDEIAFSMSFYVLCLFLDTCKRASFYSFLYCVSKNCECVASFWSRKDSWAVVAVTS
jgi:hypothetical protein